MFYAASCVLNNKNNVYYIVVQQMRCSVKCTISERAEKDVHSWRAVFLR